MTKEDLKIKALNIFIKHWFKFILLIVITGIMIMGFKCQYKDISIEKSPILQYNKGGDK